MNDPLQFTGTTEPIAIMQSSTFAGQQLPDKDFSEAKHKQISLEVVAVFFGGHDDIGAIEEQVYTQDSTPVEGLAITMADIERMPHGNYEQGQALLKMQAEQEFSLHREGHAGLGIDYVKGRDYGKSESIPSKERFAQIKQDVYDNARKHGIELDPQIVRNESKLTKEEK